MKQNRSFATVAKPCITFLCVISVFASVPNAPAAIRAGAAAVDITPNQFPVLVNGSMLTRSAETVSSRLFARAIVLSDDQDFLAIVIADSCMMPAWLLDEAKSVASKRTGIPVHHILVGATHTHSAPSAFGCLGTEPDARYVPYLRARIAESIVQASQRLQPAEVGWGATQVADLTAVRRWILRSDRMQHDPFGNQTVRAHMHVARQLDDVTGPSGPEDPSLSLLAIRTTDHRPIAMLANYSMHYFSGQQGLSADYFGSFCQQLERRAGQAHNTADKDPRTDSLPIVALMSHGCSGDIWRFDYARPGRPVHQITMDSYVRRLVDATWSVYQQMPFSANGDLAMKELRLELPFRLPDRQRLQWANEIVERLEGEPPKSRQEVYAREQVLLNQRKTADVVLQAIRVGEVAIAATPTETYALTGLKIKGQSPFPNRTMVIELANGACGYIPPPEQHHLGGYNTWPARSAGLVESAEPIIVQRLIELLEDVCDQPRTEYAPQATANSRQILAANPRAYWRLDDLSGPIARDASGNGHTAHVEPGVVPFLPGVPSDDAPEQSASASDLGINRCAHFAGGRLRASLPVPDAKYTVCLWFWNGVPTAARAVGGWIFARNHNHGSPRPESLGVVRGPSGATDHLQFAESLGNTEIARWRWYHVAIVREGATVKVHLNGRAKPELECTLSAEDQLKGTTWEWFFGGRGDGRTNWEGRLDEVAIFDRCLTLDEIHGIATAGRANAQQDQQ